MDDITVFVGLFYLGFILLFFSPLWLFALGKIIESPLVTLILEVFFGIVFFALKAVLNIVAAILATVLVVVFRPLRLR